MSALFQAGPATKATAVTPSDATTFDPPTRAIYVGTGGVLVVRMADGNNCTFSGVPNGALLPISVDRVLSTNTTATNIVRLT